MSRPADQRTVGLAMGIAARWSAKFADGSHGIYSHLERVEAYKYIVEILSEWEGLVDGETVCDIVPPVASVPPRDQDSPGGTRIDATVMCRACGNLCVCSRCLGTGKEVAVADDGG